MRFLENLKKRAVMLRVLKASAAVPMLVAPLVFAVPKDGSRLKSVVENLDDVPQEFHGLYSKRDEKFVLNVENVREHPEVTALRNALDRQKTDNATLKTQLNELKARLEGLPDDFTVEEYERLKQIAESLDPNDPKHKDLQTAVQAAVDKAKELLEAKHGREIKKLTDQLAERDTTIKTRDEQIRKLIIDSALDAAMDKALIDTKHRKAVRAMIRGDVKVIEEDGNLVAVVETPLNSETPLEQYVTDYAQSEEGRIYVASAAGGGAGGGPGGGGPGLPGGRITTNPWKKESENATQQGQLIKSDPQRAKKLAAEAGITLNIQ